VSQLGIGLNDITSTDLPVTIPNFGGALQVSAGGNHGLAVRADGTVWTWGADRNLVHLLPVQVSGLTGMTQVAAGNGSSFAVSASGGFVTSWGSNTSGQLGDGTTTSRFTPAQIAFNGVVSIDATRDGVAAIRSDGSLWAWGENSTGALGLDGFTFDRPTHVRPLGELVSVSLGYTSSLAVGRNLPLAIVSPLLPASRVGFAVRQQLDNVGGNPFYTWSATGLPSGLTLAASSGLVTGTPTASGTFTVTLRLTDGSSPVQSASPVTFAWVVQPASAPVPSVVRDLKDTAVNTLRAAGFSVQVQTFVDNNCTFNEEVATQAPVAGTVLPLGSTVTIRVGILPTVPCP
jgi:hypothetical protein